MYVGDGAAAQWRAGMRIVIGRMRWFGDQRPKEPVPPCVQRIHVVMEVGGPELHVRVSAVAHELVADDLPGGVLETQWSGQAQEHAVNRADAGDLEAVVLSSWAR